MYLKFNKLLFEVLLNHLYVFEMYKLMHEIFKITDLAENID